MGHLQGTEEVGLKNLFEQLKVQVAEVLSAEFTEPGGVVEQYIDRLVGILLRQFGNLGIVGNVQRCNHQVRVFVGELL